MACAAISIAGHIALARGLARLPRHTADAGKRVVSIRVVSPPAPEPPPEAPAPPAPTPAPTPAPPRVVHQRPRAHPTPAPPAAAAQPPPRDLPPPTGAASGPPVFGVTMESTSQAGSGPALPIGGTGARPAQPGGGAKAAPAAPGPIAPLPAYEVTTMPLPQGRCAGRYTDEAKLAGIEGTVVLDLIVDERGRPRDVHVVSGLDHGLTQAAVAAIEACRFSPGEKDGRPVPVRVRGFKIRFLLQEAE